VPYHFPYMLPVVLTYLTAYGIGLAGYILFWRGGHHAIGGVGMVLCAVGLASFAYETTHWFSDHYDSWIASAPAAAIVLAIIALIAGWRSGKLRRGQA